MATVKYVSQENLSKVLSKIKETYVQKVEGKGLSTNDLTNELLAKINGMGSVATLNEISESNLSAALAEKVNAASDGNHSHLNKDVIDGITAVLVANWNDAYAKAHEHANKAELDLIAVGDKAKWDQTVADVATVKGDYLKAADKTELEGKIEAAQEAATYDDTALAGRVKAIEDDYLVEADKTELQGNINTVSGKVDTLVGADTGKSVRTIANEELAAQLIGENAKESLNTLEEIAAWIQSHPDDASAMNEAIVALQNKVDTGDKTVSAYVTDAIAALSIGDYAKAADLTALAGRVEALEGKSHEHANKALLDTYTQTEANLADAVAKKHEHANKAELDLIASGDKAKWDAVAADYVKASEMVALTDTEIETIWANA